MRRLLTIITSILCTSWVSIWLAQHSNIPPVCGASLALDLVSDNVVQRTRVDIGTGITWADEPVQLFDFLTSPDGTYKLTSDDDNKVHLENIVNGTQEIIYRGNLITNLFWTPASDAVLVWDYDGQSGQSIVTSIDVASQATRFTYEFPASVRWQRDRNITNPYLFAQTAPGRVERITGVMFLDSRAGEITTFQNPTQFPYVWSDSGRWVASRHRISISIIDPATGDFHPEFVESLTGIDFHWQGDEALWINRIEDDMIFSVWKASLADGSVTQVLTDARLDSVSTSGAWAIIEDFQHDERYALVGIGSGERFPLPARVPFVLLDVNFNPDNQCSAILLRQREQYQLLVLKTSPSRVIHQQTLTGSFTLTRWLD